MRTDIVPDAVTLGLALRAALHDSKLERLGRRTVFFFDADVVSACLFADRHLPEPEADVILPSRSVVRSLFLQRQLPRVRLTIPHLEEFEEVLKTIEDAGGVKAHLKSESR